MSNRYRHIAEYYDAENAHSRMLAQDVPFFLGQLPHGRQRILELAVGTGRAAIPMAEAGHAVVGVDYAQDMLAIAERKRAAAGLSDKQLPLLRHDILKLALATRFDWVCLFFNTFLGFTTLDQQDQLLAVVRRHMKPRGWFWLDIFHPDAALIADSRLDNLDPHAFYVPRLKRTVSITTSLRRLDSQTQQVSFHYTWFDARGRRRRETTEFDLTFMFPRELQVLLERNGLRIDQWWGNYDGSPIRPSSPRIIARCCRK